MNISVQKLIAKIEEELTLAKNNPKEESLREKIYSIKILCELILDEKQSGQAGPAYTPTIQSGQAASAPAATMQERQEAQAPLATTPTYQPVITQPILQQPVNLNQPKKLKMDDEANGDSLFDF